jgi:carbamoyltransferase
MNVLGIHSLGHDTGVSYFEDGRLVVSLETERLTREKHDHRAELVLQHFFDRGLVDPARIDLVAASTGVRDRVLHLADYDAAMARILGGALHHETTCEIAGRRVPCLVVLHEASHAALALHYAGYAEPSLVFVNEGRGHVSRNSLYRYDGDRLELLEADALPWYATGWGWSALGWLLDMGIGPGVAGKVMALGAFGSDSAEAEALFHGIDPRVLSDLAIRDRAGEALRGHPLFRDGFESQASAVHTLQRMFTETLCDYLEDRLRAQGATVLGLGGGCALNINTNSALRRRLAGTRIAIPPACNDAGHCLGAAIYAHKVLQGIATAPFPVYSNGIAESPEEMAAAAAGAGLALRPVDLAYLAARLAEGAVVSLCQGASEIGPRALGNRSLLASPRVPGMKQRLSEGIKQREWFRPLGSVMRQERFAADFPGEPSSPHMLYAYDCPPEMMPEATHRDGTSRIQTLTAEDNPFLHNLLAEFEGASGAPALINTSLNRRNRAIATRAADVIEDFLDRDVDLFVFGDRMAERQNAGR